MNDPAGVLEGKWNMDDCTEGGIAPTEWTGSAAILRSYAQFGRPVQYAQCWVFAGTITTSALLLLPSFM